MLAVVSLVLTVIAVAAGFLADSTPAAPVPHVQSDCRAACSLEGMALAGVELTPVGPGHRVACLCAPIESSPGGDL